MRFTKYHGLGNDFVVVDLRQGGLDAASVQQPDRVRSICSRRFGVGADGILAILPTTTCAAARMRVLNADGSEAEMCGNGIRCVVKHLLDADDQSGQDALTIETGVGALQCQASRDSAGDVDRVRVEMGAPRLTRGDIPMSGAPGERALRIRLAPFNQPFTAVSMGNPHVVHFTDAALPFEELRALAESVGRRIEKSEHFPERTNVEFARALSRSEIELVVWERGCGVTLACGTGACASAVAAVLEDRCPPDTPITVRLPGGELEIVVAADLSAVSMTGPAVRVYSGELRL